MAVDTARLVHRRDSGLGTISTPQECRRPGQIGDLTDIDR
jgi:hypothetical protein